jgi:serine/threonine protein kinase
MTELFDNKYRFVKDLGEGGFGKVFLAKDELSNRQVAIKQLKNKDKSEQDSIIYEIQIIAKFNHQNIVTFFHHFYQDNFLFLVMEYCSGGSLRDVLKAGKTDLSNVVSWTDLLANTLQFVHEKGIVHHDIKPDNILFNENGTIKISDFGIANTGGGTRAYMSPEALNWERKSVKDSRVDVYALGVTLMEAITGKNPFFSLSNEQIIELHEKSDFPIKSLPNWVQEIILKSINKVPEVRFQSMKDFSEAIQAKHVPILFNKEIIKAGDLAEKAEKLLRLKKWSRAYALLDYADRELIPSVNVLRVKGKYYLLQQKIELAREYYEKALKLNPRLDVQKDLGWINLEMKNYPIAISLLSDHLHRNPSDYEAYNLLLQSFYETSRYEAAMELAKIVLDVDKDNRCFANNYYISCAMHNIGKVIFPNTVLKATESNCFLDYNFSVILETESTHGFEKKPTLKSKLLFMDYRFITIKPNTIFFTEANIPEGKTGEITKEIIKIGRDNFSCNDFQIKNGTAVSRRHCVVVNSKDDVWLYDLGSTVGVYMNDERVKVKTPLIGLNKIRISNKEYTFNPDRNKLL